MRRLHLPHNSPFILAGNELIRADRVHWVDHSEIEKLRVVIHHEGGASVAENIQAIEALLILKPSALEGKHLRWKRHVWAFHNLVGHPLMQLLAFLGFHQLALRVHDKTVPRPHL
jgi:hypothetical protein